MIDTGRPQRTDSADEDLLSGGRLGRAGGGMHPVPASRSPPTQAAAKECAAGRTDRHAHRAEQVRDSGAEGVAPFLERRLPRLTYEV